MAPPTKRRKLSDSNSGDEVWSKPGATPAVVGSPLDETADFQELRAGSSLPRIYPQRVEEVHIRLQDRAVNERGETQLEPRQAADTNSTSASAVTTESVPEQTPSPGPAATSSNTTSSGAPTALGSTSTISTNSQSTFATLSFTNNTFTLSSNRTAALFVATLTSGDTSTFSESSRAYVTTLPDGEVLTVPPSTGNSTALTDIATTTAVITTSPTGIDGGSASVVTSVATVVPTHSTSTTTSAAFSTDLANSKNSNDNSSSPPAGTIAGGVVGGAAGIAVVLLIAMLFFRWYRRRSQNGQQALPPSSLFSPDPGYVSGPSGPGMAERAGLRPLAAAVPGFLRHQNRSLTNTSTTAVVSEERGFTRVSGRKLPSAFSPGMVAGPGMAAVVPTRRDTERGHPATASATSWYHDNDPFSDDAESPPQESHHDPSPISTLSSSRGAVPERMTVSPGPQRRPTIHHAGTVPRDAPPLPFGGAAPPSDPAAMAAEAAIRDNHRSFASWEAQRGSRFLEDGM